MTSKPLDTASKVLAFAFPNPNNKMKLFVLGQIEIGKAIFEDKEDITDASSLAQIQAAAKKVRTRIYRTIRKTSKQLP
jgi:hypothetical protein